MAPEKEKRNVFLDAEESDDDDSRSYDSEAEDVRKGGHGSRDRGAKRRKLEDDASSGEEEDGFPDSDIEEEEEGDSDEEKEARKSATKPTSDTKKRKKSDADGEDGSGQDEAPEDGDGDGDTGKKRKRLDGSGTSLSGVKKPLTKKNLVASEKAVRKSGVVYLSRVPPFMKPNKLRSLLAPYGTINRIFLSPEDPLSHARRVRGGGNKRRSFVDGWVEFVRKKDAKVAVDLLNGQTIGGKKNSYYRDDIWTITYLRGFKWHHLTEQIATENAERASRMRAEIAQTTRENKEFVRNVERAKMLDGIEAKAAEKGKRQGKDAATADTAASVGAQKNTRTFTFKQTSTVERKDTADQPDRVQRVLNKIF